VSDLFVVYTDNYPPACQAIKAGTLVIKQVYWLNI